MSHDDFFDDKKILIIDQEIKDQNDRTWCYWEQGSGHWDNILFKEWKKIYFACDHWSKSIDLNDYSYKMIRSKDFYQFIKNRLSVKPNFSMLQATINKITDKTTSVEVETNHTIFTADKVISSIFNPKILDQKSAFPYLKQHFIGWFVRTEHPVFDASQAGFMDFDILQQGNTRFMYVLPTSSTEALIEYTLFSPDLLSTAEYESAIRSYIIKKFNIGKYTIVEKESGNIPMTCYPFERQNTKNIIHIGSAGGWTKPSTGYTFSRSSKQAFRLVTHLKSNRDLSSFSIRNRYWYYDLIFIKVLFDHNEVGNEVFSSIFKNQKIEDIFKFLDEENSIGNDLKIILSTKPKSKFFVAALKSLQLLMK